MNPKTLRPLVAELAGTPRFVFFGAGAIAATLAAAVSGGVPGRIAPAAPGRPQLSITTDGLHGIRIQAMLTFFLVSAVFGTAVSSEAPKIGGFGIGLAIFVCALVGGPFTGAIMNPARAFGPAIIAWQLTAQYVYWVGPLIGATLAGLLWKHLLLPKER